MIYTRDTVLYINEQHPNHLKAIVTQHSIIGDKIKFVLLFNDPPFVWEINERTGDKLKTKKKIMIMQNVDYENLRKIGSSTNDEWLFKNSKRNKKYCKHKIIYNIFFDNRTNINQNIIF